MKLTVTALIVVLTLVTKSNAQNGYLVIDGDSVLTGYLKYYVSMADGHQGIEFWRTKNDKEPKRFRRSDIEEYAIKKDTFKVFHQFKPFPDSKTFFEAVDGKIELRGKVNLYIIENYQNVNSISTVTGGGVVPLIIDESLGNVSYMYIVEDRKTGFIKALPSKREKLIEALKDFFPERYIVRYEEVNGKISYKKIPALVEFYNSK